MKHLHFALERPIALFLASIIVFPLWAQVAPAQQVPGQDSPSQAGTFTSIAFEIPHQSTTPQSTTPQPVVPAQQAMDKPQQLPAAAGVPQNSVPPATGTALAPYEKQEGVTGSKPAGAAIAAGKQRRTRSFAIRAALLVGAAIAVGVVVGASLGSPARAN